MKVILIALVVKGLTYYTLLVSGKETAGVHSQVWFLAMLRAWSIGFGHIHMENTFQKANCKISKKIERHRPPYLLLLSKHRVKASLLHVFAACVVYLDVVLMRVFGRENGSYLYFLVRSLQRQASVYDKLTRHSLT